MRFVIASARKDLRRLARDPVSILVWLGMPVFIGGLLIAIFGRQAPAPHGLLLIADEDATLVSKGAAMAFSQDKLGEMFQVEKVTQAAGRERMARGEASALLVIPKGFEAAILRNQRSELRVVTNPSQRILPQVVEETASILSDATFYLNQIAGDQLRVFAEPPPGRAAVYPDATITGVTLAFNRIFASAGKYLNPPALKLEAGVRKPPSAGGPNVSALFFPSMLAMSVLFLAMGLSGDIWHERNSGALRRIVSTAAPLWQWFSGKLISLLTVMTLAAAAAVGCARWLLELPVARPALALAWVVVAGLALHLFFLVLQMAASSDRSANILVNFCFFPLGMLGGIFFPFEAMPTDMAALARRTPIGWGVGQLRAFLSASPDTGHTALAFGLLLATAAILFAIVLTRLKRSFAR